MLSCIQYTRMDYTGKVVIITGSSRGIGKGCAKLLLEKGANVGSHKVNLVCLSGVNEEKGKETLAEFKRLYGDNVIYVRCDVKSDDDMKALFETAMETFKGLDIVVNNAGISDEKDWKTALDTNFGGVIRGTNLAMQYMRTDKGGNGGTIVNMSSLSASIPLPAAPCYSGIKAGIVNFTRAWAGHPDVSNNGVKLVCLCPGFTETDIIHVSKDKIHDYEGSSAIHQQFTIISVDDVADALLKLLEDKDNNGKSLNVFGQHDKLLIHYAKY